MKFFHKAKHDFLSSLVFSYLILYIPVLVVISIVSPFFYNRIDNQNTTIYNYILKENQQYFDKCFNDMKNVVYSLSLSNIPEQIYNDQILTNSHYPDTSQFNTYVSSLMLQTAFKFDVAIYMPDCDTVVSSDGLYSPKEYYSLKYTYSDESYRQWMDNLNTKNGFFVLDDKEASKDSRYLIYNYIAPSGRGAKSSYIFWSTANESEFSSKINSIKKETNTDFVVSDENNNILFCSDNNKYFSGSTDEIYPKNTYIAFNIKSAVRSWSYDIFINKKLYFRSTYQIKFILLYSLICCFVFSAFYIYYSIKKHGKPVVDLLSEINTIFTDNSSPEMSITLARNKIRQFSRLNSQSMNIIKREAALNLIYGDSEDYDELYDDFLIYHPKFTESYYTVLLIKPVTTNVNKLKEDGYSNDDMQTIFINIFDELLNDEFAAFVFNAPASYCCIINSAAKVAADDIYMVADKAHDTIYKYFNLDFYVSVSDCAKPAQKSIRMLYHQANNNIMYAEFMDIPANSLQYKINTHVAHSSISFEQMNSLVNYIKDGRTEKVIEAFDEIINKLQTNTSGVEFITKLKFEIIIITSMVINSLAPNNTEMNKLFDFANSIIKSNSYVDLKRDIIEYFNGLNAFIANYTSGGDNAVLHEKVLDYITQNYDNPDLCATLICEEFNIHPVYLSRMFKEKYSINMLTYINNIRIENAKKLLLDSDMTIDEIYHKVGYTNISTFNRAFKNSAGMPPGMYRKTTHDEV